MNAAPLSTRKLHRDFGVEVERMDLRRKPTQAQWAALRQALWEHSLLMFRAQPLSTADFERIGRRIGPRQSPVKRFQATGPSADQPWHAVGGIDGTPALATVLCASSRAMRMQFVSTRAGLRALPAARQEQLATLNAAHTFRSDPAAVTHHSLVVAHPYTAERSLLFGYHVRRVEGIAGDASDALVAGLMAQLTRSDRVHECRCEPGDVLIWDNWSLMHRACALSAGASRTVEEISVYAA